MRVLGCKSRFFGIKVCHEEQIPQKSQNKQMKGIKGFHIQDLLFVVFRLSFVRPPTIVRGHRDF